MKLISQVSLLSKKEGELLYALNGHIDSKEKVKNLDPKSRVSMGIFLSSG